MEQAKTKNFFRGYSLILHSLITWFFFIAAASTGLNIIVPGFAAKNHLPVPVLLSVNTIGALVAVLGTIIFSQLALKVGLKLITVLSLIIGGILGTLGLTVATTVAGYTFVCIAAQVAANGYSNSITNNVITNWFPRTRGTILGITTAGVPLAVMFAIPWLGGMIRNPNYGFDKAMIVLGGAIVIFGFLSIFWLKNTPEECGLDPDNKPLSEEEKKGRMLAKESQVKWTILEVLMNKQAILLILAFGLFYITVTGFAAQIVPFLVEAGYKPPEAIKLMGMTAIFGIAGSLISGVLDSKFGTKASSLIYAAVTLAGFAILIFAKSKTAVLATLIVEATTMGAIANLIPSFTLQCFGRNSFLSVNRVIFPGIFIVRAITYVFVAYGITNFGGYINTYATFTAFCVVGTILMFLINDKEVQVPPSKG